MGELLEQVNQAMGESNQSLVRPEREVVRRVVVGFGWWVEWGVVCKLRVAVRSGSWHRVAGSPLLLLEGCVQYSAVQCSA